MKDSDTLILELSIKALTRTLDALVGACLDDSGKPKAPSHKDLAKARGALPKWAQNAFNREAA